MRTLLLVVLTIGLTFGVATVALADSGLVSVNSAHSVQETADRLVAVLKKKG